MEKIIITEPDFLRYIEVFGIIIAAIGAAYFGYFQKHINERQFQLNKKLNELQGFVALSIVPISGFRLQITNVGKVNLYLHKWEIGAMVENFKRPLLMPTGGNVHINTSVPLDIGEKEVKIYLTDEFEVKYLSTGGIVIEPMPISQPLSYIQPQIEGDVQKQTSGNIPNNTITVRVNMRAWSYKTEKYNWNF